MTNLSLARRDRSGQAGFTLLELLVVIGIVGVLAGVLGPPIRNYMITSRIRAAANDLAGEMVSTRARAIGKNTVHGVALVVVDATTYRIVYEDDMDPTDGIKGVRQDVSTILADPVANERQLGPLRTLPQGIVINTPGPTTSGIRFTNLGAACDQTNSPANCPSLAGETPTNRVTFDTSQDPAGEYRITLLQRRSGLIAPDPGDPSTYVFAKTVRIKPGGRIYVKEDYTP
jgi:prepilin-type N-terminal cleavage/methylation domain-containing protein